MMASTARIIATAPSGREGTAKRSLASPERRGFRLDPHLGELEIGAAAHAHRIVELDDAPTGGALAPHLVALGAGRERDQQPDHGGDGADDRPDEERGSADAPDDPGRDAEPHGEREVDHSRRTAQITAKATSARRMSPKNICRTPATAATMNLNSRIATTATMAHASALRAREPNADE